RHVRARGTYGADERLLQRVDEGLGCGVERDARGDRILGAVHPVTGGQVETAVSVVGRQRLRTVAFGERAVRGAEDRLVDRTAAEVGDGEQVQADLRDLGLHVGEGGGETDDGAEVAGQHRRVAQRSLTSHRDAGDRVPAATATDRETTLDLLPQDLEMVGGQGGGATGLPLPTAH